MEAPEAVRRLATFDQAEWERFTSVSPLHWSTDARLAAWQTKARENAQDAAWLMAEIEQCRRSGDATTASAAVGAKLDGVRIHLAAAKICDAITATLRSRLDRAADPHRPDPTYGDLDRSA